MQVYIRPAPAEHTPQPDQNQANEQGQQSQYTLVIAQADAQPDGEKQIRQLLGLFNRRPEADN